MYSSLLERRKQIHESFTIINADDYYGKEALHQLHDWPVLNHTDSAIAMAGFILKNTLSENEVSPEAFVKLRIV